MRNRPLGDSGIDASVVGLGAWAMGGWMWGGTDEGESTRAIHAALDAGVNLIDTAPIYGFGLSEEIVGKAIRGRRDEVVLATKCSMICNPTVGELKFRSTALGPNPQGQIAVHVYAGPESIRQEVEASLKRLRTDRIDLLQTHRQDSTTPIAETMGGLLELKQEGKIRAIGVSNATSAQMQEYAQAGELASDQERFSMLDRQIENDQLPYCRGQGIAMLAYSPLGRGLLTGKIGPERKFAPGDLRLADPRFMVRNRETIAGMLAKFQPIADEHSLTLAQLAIAWTLHQPGLSHALCGARNASQAQENAAAGDVELSGDELAAIDAAIAEYGAK